MKVLTEFEKQPLLFADPRAIISIRDPLKIPQALARLENELDAGRYAAGFLSYEAGYSFERKLHRDKLYDFPLLQFGIYDRPARIRAKVRENNEKVDGIGINISKEEYSDNIERIRSYIENGDVYQITYCIKKKISFIGDTWELYNRLLKVQPVPYAAYIECDDMRILSLSPERFLQKTGANILVEPMKGTWWRGDGLLSDIIERYKFSKDKKNRAENVMIADLLRNDLGRIGKNIITPKLFKVTKYNTLYQMTSVVTGKVPQRLPLFDMFKALFPSGSVTGAPKIRAMEIIKELEKEERRIYTGAIGYITPNRDMYFNVPIRTLLLRRGEEAKRRRSGEWEGEMGIGGGIIWDSTPEGEWREGILKARFLSDLCDGDGH